MPHDPDRGDIILLDLSPQAGTEMAGHSVGCVVASELRTMDYIAHRARFIERAPVDLLQKVQAIACATVGCT
jgi:hypothetical protein